ncbi:LysE/ArgO family amino acid transporter [Shouchella sp. JSM 1781072]|uniref:LysE/ArgO family amino acid transporter n=1 Tax=Shouchella sp. JSM 1781072 TaxID=3344581 RepID=UPI0035BED201
MISAFINGFVLATALIIPIGPQNLLIFHQGAVQPTFKKSMPTIITSALADTLLIVVAVFGVSFALQAVPFLEPLLYLIGVGFLIIIGWTIWKSNSTTKTFQQKPYSGKKQVFLALSVSLFNPHAILDTIAVIGTYATHYHTRLETVSFAFACILVSWLAFFLLAHAGNRVKQWDKSDRLFTYIQKASAVTIWLLAFYFIYQAFLSR